MSLLAKATESYALRAPKTGNPLQAPLTRYPLGVSDFTFYSDATNGYTKTAAVFGITTCYAMHYPQVRLQVQKGSTPGGEPWPDHPLQYVLDNPNDDMSAADAALYNAIYVLLGGASHQYLYRSATNMSQVIGYRPHSTEEIKPVPIGGGEITRGTWIDHYVYKPLQGGYPKSVAASDIATLRFHSVNPLTPQLSVSPFAASFLDANADAQLTQFPLDLMKNGALVTTVFSLAPESARWDDSEFEQAKAEVKSQYTGRQKFNPVVVRGGNKVENLFPDFRKLNFDQLGQRPEVRMCVAARADIVYVGFTAGLGTSTYDNVKLARIGFVKDSVLSLARLHARTLTGVMRRQNWRNHPYGNGTSDFTIGLDLSGVMALKDEEIDLRKQSTMEYQAGGLKLNEYRQSIGQQPLPDNDPRGDEFTQVASAVGYPTPTETA